MRRSHPVVAHKYHIHNRRQVPLVQPSPNRARKHIDSRECILKSQQTNLGLSTYRHLGRVGSEPVPHIVDQGFVHWR